MQDPNCFCAAWAAGETSRIWSRSLRTSRSGPIHTSTLLLFTCTLGVLLLYHSLESAKDCLQEEPDRWPQAEHSTVNAHPVARCTTRAAHRDAVILEHPRGLPPPMWNTGGRERESLYSKGKKFLVLVSLLNLLKTKFIGFDIQFWVASFLSFPIDLGDMTFPWVWLMKASKQRVAKKHHKNKVKTLYDYAYCISW